MLLSAFKCINTNLGSALGTNSRSSYSSSHLVIYKNSSDGKNMGGSVEKLHPVILSTRRLLIWKTDGSITVLMAVSKQTIFKRSSSVRVAMDAIHGCTHGKSTKKSNFSVCIFGNASPVNHPGSRGKSSSSLCSSITRCNNDLDPPTVVSGSSPHRYSRRYVRAVKPGKLSGRHSTPSTCCNAGILWAHTCSFRMGFPSGSPGTTFSCFCLGMSGISSRCVARQVSKCSDSNVDDRRPKNCGGRSSLPSLHSCPWLSCVSKKLEEMHDAAKKCQVCPI